VAELDPQIARQRAVLQELVLAVQRHPDATWARLVTLTPQYGASLDPPVKAAEVRALHDVRIGDLFDPPATQETEETR
jgi:hypothetical protein